VKVCVGRNIIPIIKKGIIKSSGNTILGADNKVGVSTILESLISYFEQNNNLPSLEIVFTVSEESGNIGATKLDYSKIKSKVGFSFDGSGEIGSILIASPFYSRFDISVIGKSAHAGSPELGINSLTITANAISKLKIGKINENTLCNIGMISGGDARNSIPEIIKIKGEVRSYCEEDLLLELELIKNTFVNSANVLNAKIEIDIVNENAGFNYDKADKDISQVSVILRTLNFTPIFIKSLGCYDANVFYENGVKIINFGNASKHNHTVDEQISESDFIDISNICFGVMENTHYFKMV